MRWEPPQGAYINRCKPRDQDFSDPGPWPGDRLYGQTRVNRITHRYGRLYGGPLVSGGTHSCGRLHSRGLLGSWLCLGDYHRGTAQSCERLQSCGVPEAGLRPWVDVPRAARGRRTISISGVLGSGSLCDGRLKELAGCKGPLCGYRIASLSHVGQGSGSRGPQEAEHGAPRRGWCTWGPQRCPGVVPGLPGGPDGGPYLRVGTSLQVRIRFPSLHSSSKGVGSFGCFHVFFFHHSFC